MTQESTAIPVERQADQVDLLDLRLSASALEQWGMSMVSDELKAMFLSSYEPGSPELQQAELSLGGLVYMIVTDHLRGQIKKTEDNERWVVLVEGDQPDPDLADLIDQKLKLISQGHGQEALASLFTSKTI